jgi:hypothetical protein
MKIKSLMIYIMTKLYPFFSDLPEIKKNEILEKLRNTYGDTLINEIFNNKDEYTRFIFDDIVLR